MINKLTSINVPHRNRDILPANLHSSYDSIEKGLLSFSDSIALYGVSQYIADNLQLLWAAVCLDHPEIFYIGRQFELSERRSLELHPQYTLSPKDVGKISIELMNEVRRVDKALAITQDPYRIVLSIHDWLASTITYKEGAIHAFDVTGALLDHEAVCQGISAAASLMINYAGIPCATYFGKLRQKNDAWHAWNVINLKGKLGHMDITNDLVSIHKHTSHSHLLMSEPTAHRVLSWQGKVGDPIDFDYYLVTGAFANTIQEFAEVANDMTSAGLKSGEIKVPIHCINKIESEIPKVFAGFKIKYSYNPNLEVFSFKLQ